MPTARKLTVHSVLEEHAAVMDSTAPQYMNNELVQTQQNDLRGWGNETVL
jgi:hypothetical protein